MLIEAIPDFILLQLYHSVPHTRNMTLGEAHEMQREIMDRIMEVVDEAFKEGNGNGTTPVDH